MGDYLEKGAPVYLSANKELLGYIHNGKDSVKVTLLTEAETEAPVETGTSEETEAVSAESDTEQELKYRAANLEGKIRLSADVKVYSDGIYYSIGDINFAPGSVLVLYTEEAVFTVTVKSIVRAD